jgi:membrane protein DedA with SNARE-associated domain
MLWTMFASVTGQITDAISAHGALAVFLLMALDAVLPAGGELVMLYAGVLAAGVLAHRVTVLGVTPPDGLPAYLVVTAVGALGYLAGSLGGWAIGMAGGRPLVERHGRWLHLGPDRLARAERWFHRFGSRAVFLGRLTPLVRSFISIPAGVFRAPLGRYTVLTLAGSLIWCAVFAGVGWAVGTHWESVHHALRYVDYAVIAAAGVVVAVLAVRWRRAAVDAAE